MPRMLAKEFVFTLTSTDERYNEYITPTTSPLQPYHSGHRHQQQATSATVQAGVLAQKRSYKCGSHSPPCIKSVDLSPELQSEPQIETQSNEQRTFSMDGKGEPAKGDRNHTSMSSVDNEDDFEGFDEDNNCTREGSAGDVFSHHVQVTEASGLQQKVTLKRPVEYCDYHEDSEGVVEAIEVDDDEDIEEVDGQKLLKSKQETTPDRDEKALSECNPHTPSKRKKHQCEGGPEAIVSQTDDLKPQLDNVVVVNSDSTTISQKQKRHQINTRFQLNFNQRQNQRKANNDETNKSSTESTSEFPVSSPSNPQQYPPRTPLLKNTLPADSFERHLATITAFNPQMTLTEKIENWCCEDELSDIDDVTLFDKEFTRIEDQRKRFIRKQKNQKSGGVSDTHYNFAVFKEIILNKMKNQKNEKFLTGIGADGTRLAGGASKDINSTTASDSSKSDLINDERPSTSAVAQQQIQLRRSKLNNINVDASDLKKRIVKEFNKRNENSTTPPATSSSENERVVFQKSKPSGPNKQFPPGSQNIRIHEKLLCPSSSEEANSQDVPTYKQLREQQRTSQKGCETNAKPSLKSPTEAKNSKNSHHLAGEEIDSVFRLHRLNREIDKPLNDRIFLSQQLNFPANNLNRAHTNSHEGLIQVHLNFQKEDKISDQTGYNKKPDIFKTPIVPPKYFPNQSVTATNASLIQNCSFSTNVKTPNEQINEESSEKTISISNSNVTSTKVKTEMTDTEPEYDGVYHQQHEFCNYLGLTGMSTATAMANAVAELAQCNLTRRSLRVLRQQQQERKEKSAKEDREHKNRLKAKELKECRRHLRSGHEVNLESEESMLLNEEGTNSHSSERSQSTRSLTDFKRNINSRMLSPKASSQIHSPVIAVKSEPQIKILYHIGSPQKQEIDIMCDKEILKPFRDTLLRRTNQKSDHKMFNRQHDFKDEIKSETNSNSIQSAEILESEELSPPPFSKTLRSVLIKRKRDEVRQTTIKEAYLNDIEAMSKNKLDYKSYQPAKTPIKMEAEKTTSYNIKTASAASVNLTQLKIEYITKDQSNEKIHNSSHEDHMDECDRSLTPTATSIKEKLQAALDESRKSKPNIYIVQSLECKKEDPTKPVTFLNPPEKGKVDIEPLKDPPVYVSKVEIKKQMISGQEEIEEEIEPVEESVTKKKNKKKLFKALTKSKKHHTISTRDTNERELRSQKPVPIKTSESEENQQPKEEIQKKTKLLRSQSRSRDRNSKTTKSLNISSAQSEVLLPKNTKCYRNAETETKDLELYNNQAKTRLMAKATALLQRSRRMSITRGLNNSNSLAAKLSNHKISSKTPGMRPRIRLIRANIDVLKREYKIFSTSTTPPPEPMAVDIKPLTSSTSKGGDITDDQRQQLKTNNVPNQDNDNVVVSSTTNSCDERQNLNPHHSASAVIIKPIDTPSRMITKDTGTQMDKNHKQGLRYLRGTPSATHIMRNPLKKEHGVVHYLYYEVDTLIVVQDRSVSFWKCSRLLGVLSSVLPTSKLQKGLVPQSNMLFSQATASSPPINAGVNVSDSSSSSLLEFPINSEWIMLGELNRLTYDLEVSAPYANRICLHNSTPIYVEMRARQLPKHNRSCNLLSMYINIYYYHDDDIIAKSNSIQLDTIQSDIKCVNYTTLLDSRYFIMTWPQENRLGKVRCGLCKYSLTPQLDTLASIREFKSMRHTIRYLECINDDKLLGFSDTQLTVWDHRSGDVLMKIDLDMPLGKHLGSMYYKSEESIYNNMIILFQWRQSMPSEPPELLALACTVTHFQPSFRILYQFALPKAFNDIKRAINTGEHLIIIGSESDGGEAELWISCGNPSIVAQVPPSGQDCKRFYSRERSQLLELTERTLNLDTVANHTLKLAAALAFNSVTTV